ncbi:hypothetical protein NL108_017781 [Boleophthalmus pectinirostris]|nr:hypothetical protein NL108_017781 [Boleophthalmus pectinirostris]
MALIGLNIALGLFVLVLLRMVHNNHRKQEPGMKSIYLFIFLIFSSELLCENKFFILSEMHTNDDGSHQDSQAEDGIIYAGLNVTSRDTISRPPVEEAAGTDIYSQVKTS